MTHALEVIVGQRTARADDGTGAQTVRATYAGLGTRHLLVVCDASAAPVATQLAARHASESVADAFKGARSPRSSTRLEAALAKADRAIRDAALGSHAEGRAGAAIIAAALDAQDGLSVARLGGGRAILISQGVVRPLFAEPGRGYAGDGVTPPELARVPGPLPVGSRLILLSEPLASAVGADAVELSRGMAPQLAAVRLVETGRGRGRQEALGCLVLDVESEALDHEGVHPLYRRLEPELGADPEALATRRARPIAALVFFLVGLLMGSGVAIQRAESARADAEKRRAALARAAREQVPVEPPAPEPQDLPVAEVAPPPEVAPDLGPSEPTPAERRFEARMRRIFFEQKRPRSSAYRLRTYLVRAQRKQGKKVFRRVEAWVRRHAPDDKRVVSALVELMRIQPDRKTRDWLSKLLPDLYQGE